jgi:hypothetical protein
MTVATCRCSGGEELDRFKSIDLPVPKVPVIRYPQGTTCSSTSGVIIETVDDVTATLQGRWQQVAGRGENEVFGRQPELQESGK